MKTIVIFGAGFAGLLAGQMFRQVHPTIYEAQSELPKNHGAVLRFRSDTIEKYTGIDLKEIEIRKSISMNGCLYTMCDIEMGNRYSIKVSGHLKERSIWSVGEEGTIDVREKDPRAKILRYISNGDLTGKLTNGLEIVYDSKLTTDKKLIEFKKFNMPVISTIPMPVMMKIIGWKDMPDFSFKPIWVATYHIDESIKCSIHHTIYFPGSEDYYRATLSDNALIVEYSNAPKWRYESGVEIDDDIGSILRNFGVQSIPEHFDLSYIKEQKFGKITPIDSDVRKAFMYHLTQKYGIYSLGRFATWKQILLEDVIDDCLKIKKMINSNSYEQKLMRE